MKITFRSTAVLLLFILLATKLPAQKLDYLIIAEGDTLAGKVVNRYFNRIRFKAYGSTIVEKKTAKEIKGFIDDKKVYLAKNIPGELEPLFLEERIAGPISLYEYFKTTGADRSTYIMRWYVSKYDGELVEVKSNWGATASRKDRKAVFEDLISDRPELLEQYKASKSFDHETLFTFIKNYNKLTIESKASEN